MIETMGEQVKDFQERILGAETPTAPALIDDERALFRADCIEEELGELREAIRKRDHKGQVDALIDLMYFAMGTLIEMGSLPRLHFDEVHLKNMEKKRGTKSTRPHSKGFDAIKPEGWTEPDHAKILAELELRAQVSPVLVKATKLRLGRSSKYNQGGIKLNDHFPFGLKSYVHQVFDKALRAVSMLHGDCAFDDPTLIDSLEDSINYSVMTLEEIERRKADAIR